MSDAPSILAIEDIAIYEYQLSHELRISRWETINEIKGILLIKYDQQKQPKDYKAEIEMKQINEESSEMVQKLTFRCVGCEVKPDNTFRCIFQENPLPAANEFDAQNPRKLSISLTGSFDNLEMNGLLVWNEVTGRQANARIKMTLKKIGRP